jgi:hypothetical protein
MGDVEEAKKLFLECEQIYAKVHGQNHSDTLDAARHAQNVRKERGGGDDEKNRRGRGRRKNSACWRSDSGCHVVHLP